MTNTKSELYEKHPEWIVNAPKRELSTGRGGTQLVLDMGNPEVQDFVFGVVDDLMTKYPEIAYIKWDANMSVQSPGTTYLTKRQPEPPLHKLPPRLGEHMSTHKGKISRPRDTGLRQWRRQGELGSAALLRRVLGKRQHRRAATRVHAVGNVLLLPGNSNGVSHQRGAQPPDSPQRFAEIPHRRGHERPARHGDTAQEHDRRGKRHVQKGHCRIQADKARRAVRRHLQARLPVRQSSAWRRSCTCPRPKTRPCSTGGRPRHS